DILASSWRLCGSSTLVAGTGVFKGGRCVTPMTARKGTESAHEPLGREIAIMTGTPPSAMEIRMSTAEKSLRRSFLSRVFGAVAASSFSFAGVREAAAQEAGPDSWLKEVKGRHRC